MIQNPITGAETPVFGPKVPVSGFRLIDARASYGLDIPVILLNCYTAGHAFPAVVPSERAVLDTRKICGEK